MARVGVLVSGQGTNLQVLLDGAQDGSLGAEIALVGCNRADAPAIGRAERAGVPVCLIDRREIRGRSERQRRLLAALREARVDIVVLAGFDEILSDEFVHAYRGRMINTHPALLPAFGGTMHAVRQALEHGVKITGCTLHLVTEEPDGGPILFQAAVEVRDDDTEESLRARIQAEEHRLLPLTVRALAEDRVRVEGRRARVIASAALTGAPGR